MDNVSCSGGIIVISLWLEICAFEVYIGGTRPKMLGKFLQHCNAVSHTTTISHCCSNMNYFQ